MFCDFIRWDFTLAFFSEFLCQIFSLLCQIFSRLTVWDSVLDINECWRGTHECPALSFCVNTIGSRKCECDFGYIEQADGSCENKDECDDGDYNCPANTWCKDYDGGYRCECASGYRLNDTDQCEGNYSFIAPIVYVFLLLYFCLVMRLKSRRF